MEYLLTIITSIVALYFGFVLYLRRGRGELSKNEAREIKTQINGLLTDFNRVSNANINILEEKIKCLEDLVNLADEKIEKLNKLIVDAGITINRETKPLITKEISIPKTKVTREYERVKGLSKEVSGEGVILSLGDFE